MLSFIKKSKKNHEISEHINDSNIFCSEINSFTWFNQEFPKLCDPGAISSCNIQQRLVEHTSENVMPFKPLPHQILQDFSVLSLPCVKTYPGGWNLKSF